MKRRYHAEGYTKRATRTNGAESFRPTLKGVMGRYITNTDY